MEPATKNDLLNLATKDDVGKLRRMLEEDMSAISDDIRKTNSYLQRMIKKHEDKLNRHENRITKLEKK